MASIQKINRLLASEFMGCVEARQERAHLLLTGACADWREIVRAGYLAAKHNPLAGVVNKIEWTGGEIPKTRIPETRDNSLDGLAPDVMVIGGGVVGCAIARELTRKKLSVLLVDKEADVALHASSRNDGMIHPGLDIKKSSQKYHYNRLGNAMFEKICGELQVPFKRGGQYLCFPKKIPVPALYATKLYWAYMGIPSRVLGKKRLFQEEPGLRRDLGSALFFSTAGSVCPYGLTIAYAENAIQNGARFALQTAVLGMDVTDGTITAVRTNRGTLYPKVIVNAAGVFSGDIAAMADDQFFSIHPRRGTNSICDKKYSDAIARQHASTLFTGHSKGAHTKGGGVIRTVHGNLLLGPDAAESPEKENFATAQASIQTVLAKQVKTSDKLHQGRIITYFTGIRASTYEEDFVVCRGRYTKNIVHAAGIQSPGLTAAPALGVAVAQMAVAALFDITGIAPRENPKFNPVREAIPNTAEMPSDERAALIAKNPNFGVIVCRCEEISKGEIIAALQRPLPCASIDGVKRRVRAGMGRCQGGFCGPQVAKIIADEKGIPLEAVLKSGEGSELLFAPLKTRAEEGGGGDA
ncbi:MAG: FAD-dependent oxidoreductase [Oscillospiraceae bacterium]|jgi:glycerol-3-phosphate dehydrogenase|nr:FAD-dependent oxidoreductase [Oscillospiraceae bacterium]